MLKEFSSLLVFTEVSIASFGVLSFCVCVRRFMIRNGIGLTYFTPPILPHPSCTIYYKKVSCQYYFDLTFCQNGQKMSGVRLLS